MNGLADVFQPHIAGESSRQQSRFAENLEAIADSQYQASAIGKLPHRLHHGRKFGNRPGAQIVAVRETSGHDDGVAILQIMGVVPKKRDRLLSHILDRPVGIMIAIGSGENDDAKFHDGFLTCGDKKSLARRKKPPERNSRTATWYPNRQ